MEHFLNWPQELTREPLTGMDSHVLVKNLPATIDEQTLRQIFSKFGDVTGLEILPGAEGTTEAIIRWGVRGQAIEAVKALNGAPTDRGGKLLEITCPGFGVETSPGYFPLLWT